MTGHVDAETLAAFREGLLSRRRAARVSAHLAACPRCAESDAGLAGITALLAAAQAPPMPAGLSARIEAALAAEAVARAAAGAPDGVTAAAEAAQAGGDVPADETTGGGHRPGGRHVPRTGHPRTGHPPAGRPPAGPRHRGDRDRSRPRSRMALRAGVVTAAIAVIVGGGYGVSLLLSNGITTGASSSAGGASHSASQGKVAAPGALSPGEGSGAAAGAGSLPVVHSGTDYQRGRLGAQVTAVLTRHRRPRAHASQGVEGSAPAPFGTNRGLLACVRRVSGGVTPRLVDLATYQGRPATVIVVPAGRNRANVFVVGGGCTRVASDVVARTSVVTRH